MKCSASSCRALLVSNFVVFGLGVILVGVPAAASPLDPDVPSLQAYAERGSIKEEIELGAAYYVGRGVPQDEKRAAYWYEKAANAGDPGAQREIGIFYQAGIGVPRDDAQAVRWYLRAVAGGLVSAKVNLGAEYLRGGGARKDPVLAAQLFRQAFAQGYGVAACYLGQMYLEGIGVERDEAAGKRWYESGAKLHDPHSQFQLADLLWHRTNNPNDVKRAAKLLREASGQGLVAAKHQLAILLERRPDLAISPGEAPALLTESAEAGEWRSSLALAVLNRDGMGIPVDSRSAYYHYRVAALQGGEEADQIVANDLKKISAQLGVSQAAELDSEAEAWFEKHHRVLQFVGRDGADWKETPAYAARPAEESSRSNWLFPVEAYEATKIPSNPRLKRY